MKRIIKDKILGKVFFPILLETVLLILTGVVDTLMLSAVGDEAVASVGTSNTFIGLVLALFMVVSSGLIAVMTQYIGAEKKGYSVQAKNTAIIMNGLLGITISSLFLFTSDSIIINSGIAENLRADAILYLKIVGAGTVLDALIVVFSCSLKAFDKSQYSLISVIAGNAVNLILNSVFLFGFGSGVLGVSISTVIGKIVNLFLCVTFGKILIKEKQYKERTSYKTLIKQIFKIGVPAALESAIYSAMLTVIVIILAGMDKNGFSTKAKTYATQITNFSYCVGFALAQATVIVNGWKIGDDKQKDCYFQTHKAAVFGISCGVLFETIFAIISPWLLRFFTNDPELIRTISIILYIDIAIEAGKAASLVYGMTLKSTGDSVFTTAIAFIFNSLFAIGGAYLFGIVFDLGAIGVYLALMLDECTRAALLFFRFRSGKWERKIVTKKYNGI